MTNFFPNGTLLNQSISNSYSINSTYNGSACSVFKDMFKQPGTYFELAPESVLKINNSLDVQVGPEDKLLKYRDEFISILG